MPAEDKKIYGILVCIAIGSIVLLASLFYGKVDQYPVSGDKLIDFSTDWKVSTGDRTLRNIRVPAHIDNVALGSSMVLENTLPEDIKSQTYVFFRASHQKVRVFIENKLVYTFGWDEQRLFGKSPACNWVLVPLSEGQQGEPIKIELTGIYERYDNLINGIYLGNKGAVLHEIISKRLGSILICFILIVIGTGMAGVAAALRNGRITASLRRLGSLSVLIGSWSLCVTNTLQIFYGNVFFLLNLEFFLFNLLFPVFLWFLLSFQHYKEQRWLHLLFWAAIGQFFVIQGLQLSGIADYMESIIITHVLLAGGIGCLFAAGIRDLLRRNATKEVRILVFSVALLLLSAGIDLVRFYQSNIVDEGFYVRIGMLIFIVLWAFEVIRNMSKRFVSMARTEALEILAYEDLMTGLKNRTAFEERMNDYENGKENEDAYIITFDMNGLKEINDNFGHMKGDQAIIAIAHIIKNA